MDRRLKIYFENEQSSIPVTYGVKILVRHAIQSTLDFEDFSRFCEVSVTFTDNEKIRELNSRFRGIDRATDVLSFPMIDDKSACNEPVVQLGDIVLSLEKAKEQGELYGHGFERELAFLCIHSVLHLLGYDHIKDDEEAEMRRRQSAIASIMGLGVKEEDK